MAMAARSSMNSTGQSWSKWQVALIVGAPVAIGIGYWYLRQAGLSASKEKSSVDEKSKTGNASSTEPSKTATPKSKGMENKNRDSAGQKPLHVALSHKNAGNDHFKSGRFNEAIDCYNDAIELCPKDRKLDLATFYQNRAAAYEQLKMYQEVCKDCTRALDLNPKYIKALQRRAKACEMTHDLQQSLEDITAACILEGFQNQSTLLTADRVLKELGKLHAKEAMAKRKPIMPSKHFIKTYFSSFVEDPIINDINNGCDVAEADLRGFARAAVAFKKQNFEEVIDACNEEIQVNGDNKMKALVLRATFYLLLGDHVGALKDFEGIINDENVELKLRVNAYIKRASLYMQLEQPRKSLEDFNHAAKLDRKNSDVYHHRGQVYLLMEKVNEAIEDFREAVSLNPNFPIAYVQKCYTDYRYAFQCHNLERMKEVMNNFALAVERFPHCSECYTLFAQVLCDQQEYDRADSYFRKAVEVEPENATVYVHRGLLQLQWNGDVAKAIELITRALEMDDRCEFGYETLGTIEVQRGNLKHAVELFDKAIPLAKTELEMSHLFSLRDAAVAQASVAEKMGIPLSNFSGP